MDRKLTGAEKLLASLNIPTFSVDEERARWTYIKERVTALSEDNQGELTGYLELTPEACLTLQMVVQMFMTFCDGVQDEITIDVTADASAVTSRKDDAKKLLAALQSDGLMLPLPEAKAKGQKDMFSKDNQPAPDGEEEEEWDTGPGAHRSMDQDGQQTETGEPTEADYAHASAESGQEGFPGSEAGDRVTKDGEEPDYDIEEVFEDTEGGAADIPGATKPSRPKRRLTHTKAKKK